MGEIVEVLHMAVEDACEHDMLVQLHWQGREVAIPLSQLDAIGADESTQEAIGDCHYGGRAGLYSLKANKSTASESTEHIMPRRQERSQPTWTDS